MSALQDDWFRCTIDKKLLKSLSRRSDRPALIWFGAYFGLLAALGLGTALTWGSAWSLAFLVPYGLVWGAAASGVHETCHGTPFRSRWLNEAALWAFGWMVQMEPVSVRWGHAGHHSFTHFDEGDTELSEPNPVSWGNFFSVGSGLGGTVFYWRSLLAQACGRIAPAMLGVIPPAEVPKAVRNARYMVASYGAVVLLAVAAQSWLPIALVFLPRLIGGPVTGFLHLTQHTWPCHERAGPPPVDPQLHGRAGHPLLLFQYEPPHRAPHVPHGALLQFARAQRRNP